jgi:hypothetical protein
VVSLDLPDICEEWWLLDCVVRTFRVESLLLYRLILTDGIDRTPTSSESEWPSAERKER